MAASQAIRQIFKNFRTLPGFDRNLGHLKLISTSEGKLHCEVPIEKGYFMVIILPEI